MLAKSIILKYFLNFYVYQPSLNEESFYYAIIFVGKCIPTLIIKDVVWLNFKVTSYIYWFMKNIIINQNSMTPSLNTIISKSLIPQPISTAIY